MKSEHAVPARVACRAPAGFSQDLSHVAAYADREREADRLAARKPDSAPAALAPDPADAPAILADAWSGPGRPLDAGVAARLGPAAEGVRVHDHPPAYRAARALGAAAFAAGRHIVFGEGHYRPGTARGDRLLAHEVAHLEQQAVLGAARIDRQSDEAATLPKIYAPLLDRIRVEENDEPDFPPARTKLPVLRDLEAVARAVESGDAARTQDAITDFLTSVEEHPFDASTATSLGSVPLTIVSRVFLLGLRDEAKALESHFFGKRNSADYEQPTTRGGYATNYEVLASITREAIARGTARDARQAEPAIDLILRAFKGIIDAAAALDPAVVKADREAARRDAAALGASGGYPDLMRNPDQTAGSHYTHLLDLLPSLITTLQTNYQLLVDETIAGLESGNGQEGLKKLRAVLEGKMKPVFNAHPTVPLAEVETEVTKSDFEKREKRHLDFFYPENTKASIGIEPYDKDTPFFAEKSVSLGRIYELHEKQIAALERLYGFQTDAKGAVTAESKENAGAAKAAGGLKLHDDESWRKFLLEKFEAARTAGKDDWEALLSTVNVLGVYLDAFTGHTPYNIAEFGDNYLTRTFPRALTGQLIHDCGVYALRIAYALSLVRAKLNLQFRAIVLPVHVGLIISFADSQRREVLLTHNNKIVPVSADKLGDYEKEWGKSVAAEPPGKKTPKAGDRSAFLADLAAAEFVERVDIPYQLLDVPAPAKPGQRAKHPHDQVLWKFYGVLSQKRVVEPTKDVQQPELLYLDILHGDKALHNELRVPLYRAAHKLLQAHRAELESAAATLSSGDAAKMNAAQETLDRHKAELVKMFAPMTEQIKALDERRSQVDAFLKDNPKALTPEATVSRWLRMRITHWNQELFDYLGDATTAGFLSTGFVSSAPWNDADKLPQHTE